VSRVRPEYPEELRRRGIEGTVMVQVLVATDGLVEDVRIVKSIPDLDPYAVAAAREWKFKPALAGGKPVATWVGVPIKFPPQ
jgi:protein TonB